MRKATCLVLVTAIIISLASIFPSFASTSAEANYEKAVDLKILGLLNGNGTSFDLGRTPTRVEGACMLVRLLGKEQEAKNLNLEHPFTDVPSWADSQIGFMYQNGLTTGSGGSVFGASEPLSALQYVTFVLRSLGYDDRKGDFQYSRAIEKAVQAGLLSSSEASSLKNKTSFLRDDLVGISYNALKAKLKASTSTLLDKLVTQDKAVSKACATVLGLYTSDLKNELGNITDFKAASSPTGYIIKNNTDLFKILRKSLYTNATQINIDFTGYNGSVKEDFVANYDRAVDAVTKSTGVTDLVQSWKYQYSGSLFKLTVNYRYSKNEFKSKMKNAANTVYKARHIIAGIIKPSMSEFAKELALHDYIINNTKYDYKNYLAGTIPDSSYDAYGCLVLGTAVCQGYSEAMKLLCDLSNLDCLVICGETKSQNTWTGHCWNIIKIAGKYYHLDVTFDDPVSSKNEDTLTYFHFNLPDDKMINQYRWNKSDYPVCSSLESNYFYKNGLVVASTEDFENAVLKAVNQRKLQIVLKVENYDKESYSDLSDVMFRSGDVSSFRYTVDDENGIISITNIKYM